MKALVRKGLSTTAIESDLKISMEEFGMSSKIATRIPSAMPSERPGEISSSITRRYTIKKLTENNYHMWTLWMNRILEIRTTQHHEWKREKKYMDT